MNDENTPEVSGSAQTPDMEPAATSDHPTAAVGQIASDLAATMPEPQEHAIEAARTSEPLAQKIGNVKFDSSIHAVNEDGSPRLTATGEYAKKRGRKTNGAKSTVATKADKPTPTQSEVAARSSGVVAARALLAFGVILGGDEWKPRVDDTIGLDEAKQLEDAFAGYFEAMGYTDIPPGWALTIVMASYALPRFFMPKTQSRIKRVKDWIVAKYVQWRVRKSGANVNVQPRT